VQRAQARARAHGQAARIAGHAMPPAVVLDAPQPAAYCVPGRPATIVLTTAALAILDADQLTAVLAHERAHLAGRHHLLTGLTRGLAAVFPAVPLFTRGPLEVARLAELRADDAAARRSGRRTLVAALLAMGTGAAVPAAALAATGGATAARVQRLLDPPGRTARGAVALMTVTLVLAAASAVIPVLAA
jgi:Zn-dependent protease with chaperone function